jgi:hypothetical protein
VFLLKPRTLFGLPSGDREIFNLLERLRTGTQELPPGCEVTYELEAVEILKSLLKRVAGQADPIAAWAGGRGTAGVSYFAYEDRNFRTTINVEPGAVAGLQELVPELAEWHLGVPDSAGQR